MRTPKPIPETRELMLLDVINTFNSSNRCVVNDKCRYLGHLDETEILGCAIGQYLETDLATRLDTEAFTSVWNSKAFASLPMELQILSKHFLSSIQMLHDNPDNWTSEYLSDKGVEEVENIISTFKLEIDKVGDRYVEISKTIQN